MRSSARNVAVVAVASLVVAIAALWWFYPYLDDARRDWMMRWPPTASEASAFAQCADPGWGGLTKILEQDLDDGCPVGWFPRSAAEHLERRAERRLRRLDGVARDPARPLRSRLRAALTLALVGQPVPPDLAILTREPAASALRAQLLDELHTHGWPVDWVDPELAIALELRAAEGGPERGASLRVALADAATRSDQAAARIRGELAAELFEQLDLEPESLRGALDRRARGRPLGHLPPAVARAVHHGDLSPCSSSDSPECALWLLGAVPPPDEQVASPDAAGALAWSWSLLSVAGEDHPGLSQARAIVFQRYVAYVLAEQPPRRAERLAALLSARAASGRPAREIGVDPLSVLRGHAGEPWVVALTAQVVGALTAVPVDVGFADGRVAIRVGAARWWLDGCGARVAAAADASWPEPWPIEAVAAQAALSMAERGAPGDPVDGRLRAVAARMDPVAAPALEPTADAAGWAVGVQIASHWPTVGEGAAPARRAAAAWRASSPPAARCGEPGPSNP